MGLPERQRTAEGWEMQFATNHLGHFALALGLHEALAADGDARIVSVSSEAHLRSPLVFDDLNFSSRPYDPWLAYGQSKTANVLFAVEAARRWGGDGITVNAVHPGAVPGNQPCAAPRLRCAGRPGRHRDGGYEYKTPRARCRDERSGRDSHLSSQGISGHYFADCNEAPVVDSSFTGPPRGFGVAPYALDARNASRLWELSLNLVPKDSMNA